MWRLQSLTECQQDKREDCGLQKDVNTSIPPSHQQYYSGIGSQLQVPRYTHHQQPLLNNFSIVLNNLLTVSAHRQSGCWTDQPDAHLHSQPELPFSSNALPTTHSHFTLHLLYMHRHFNLRWKHTHIVCTSVNLKVPKDYVSKSIYYCVVYHLHLCPVFDCIVYCIMLCTVYSIVLCTVYCLTACTVVCCCFMLNEAPWHEEIIFRPSIKMSVMRRNDNKVDFVYSPCCSSCHKSKINKLMHKNASETKGKNSSLTDTHGRINT